MAKQSYGTSTGGVNRSEKGDLPSDKRFTGYNSRGPLTDLSTKGSLPDKKFSGYNSPAPKAAPGKGNPSVRNTRESPRTYVPSRIKQIFDPTPFATPVAKKPPAKKPTAPAKSATPGMAPTRATQPTRMAVNPRTGNTTGFTTGKTTGTSVSKSGVATKTYQSAGDRMKANTERRFGVAGPTGGGSSRSSTSGGSSRTSGGGNLGGAAGRISEDRGSKR